MKIYEYRIKLVAKEDLISIKHYLAEMYAENAYIKLVEKFYSQLENLKFFPNSGTIVKSKKFKKYRYLIVENYYIFYTFNNDKVTIERILHTSRNYKNFLTYDDSL